MMSDWRTRTGRLLLVLMALGLAAPLAAALDSAGSCCAGMEMGGEASEPPARCQWLTPASCCDEGAVIGGVPPFAPPASLCTPVLTAWPPAPSHGALPAAVHPTDQRRSLSTIVLRL